MKIIQSDISDWFEKDCNLLVTTNAVKNSQGNLVMGAGSALTFKIQWPGLPSDFGSQLIDLPINTPVNLKYEYNLIRSKINPNVWAWQTKYHWRRNSELELVTRSIIKLAEYVKKSQRPWYGTAPGCGLGGLDKAIVYPLLEYYIPGEQLIICEK